MEYGTASDTSRPIHQEVLANFPEVTQYSREGQSCQAQLAAMPDNLWLSDIVEEAVIATLLDGDGGSLMSLTCALRGDARRAAT